MGRYSGHWNVSCFKKCRERHPIRVLTSFVDRLAENKRKVSDRIETRWSSEFSRRGTRSTRSTQHDHDRSISNQDQRYHSILLAVSAACCLKLCYIPPDLNRDIRYLAAPATDHTGLPSSPCLQLSAPRRSRKGPPLQSTSQLHNAFIRLPNSFKLSCIVYKNRTSSTSH